jgi:hypothetical protein
MKKLLLAIGLLTPLTAPAELNVEWVNPKEYRDPWATSMHSDKSRQTTLTPLEDYMQYLAKTHVKDGQVLTIRVTDLDLAGRFEPGYGPNLDDVRVIKSVDFAHIKFDYTLTDAEGNVVKEGSETLRHDLLVPLTIPNRDEHAPYVRDLIQDWMEKNFD